MKRFVETTGSPSKSLGDGVFEARLIQSGWNASKTRYYTVEGLKTTGAATFREGRPCFANHPTDDEFENGRDIKSIWGRLASDAEFREDDQSLWAKVKVRPEQVDFVEEYKDTIGMSIFAEGDGHEGEAEGSKGLIVESFSADFPYTSVDFVVAAGAGGKVMSRIAESASIPVAEALDSQRRIELQKALRDLSQDSYTWLRDYDDEKGVVYFEQGDGVFAQSFEITDSGVSLTGNTTEVIPTTVYQPVNQDSTSKENHQMTPEEKAEFAAAVATAVAEALKPAADEIPDGEVATAPSPAEIAEAVRAAALLPISEKRVFEALKADPKADVLALVEAEKTFAAALLSENGSPGRLRESQDATPTNLTLEGWK